MLRGTSPVPLYPVSLAFASGCVLGISTQCTEVMAGLFLAGALVIWLLFCHWGKVHLSFWKWASLATFYVVTGCYGLLHTAVSAQLIPGDDARHVPESIRDDPQTTWLAVVIDEPQETPPSRRLAKAHQAFTLELKAWRRGNFDAFQSTDSQPSVQDSQAVWQSVSGFVPCRIGEPNVPIELGDELVITGQLRPSDPPLVPGQIDTRAILARQGIFFRLESAGPPRLVRKNQESYSQYLSTTSKKWVYRQLRLGIEDDPQVADTLTGMLIGYRQSVPLEVEDDFRHTGTLHVFAVSGQNVSEVAELGIIFLSLTPFLPWRSSWVVAPVLILFCMLTGSQASAIRATIMALVILLAWVLGRPINAKGLWSIAFLLMLIWDPEIVADPGAQLSFGVVWGLIFISPALARPVESFLQPDAFIPRRLWEQNVRWEKAFWRFVVRAVAASLSASLICEPIAAYQFHQFSPISVIANLVVVPLAGLITLVGTLSVAFSYPLPVISGWINNSNWAFARVLLWVVNGFSLAPYAYVNVSDIQTIREQTPSITIFPFQSSSAGFLLRTSTQTWLFNTGRDTDARYITEHLCQYYGVNHLSGLTLLQMNTEANGGEAIIDQSFHPVRLVLPALRTRARIQKAMDEEIDVEASRFEAWTAGDAIALGKEASIQVLWPEAPGSQDAQLFTRAPDRAMVLQLHIGRTTFLWLGSSVKAVRDRVVQLHPDLRADIVVLGSAQDPTADEALFVSQLHCQTWVHFREDTYSFHDATADEIHAAAPYFYDINTDGAVTFCINPDGSTRVWTLPK